MDAYEATRVVFSRIQSLDPANAAKIMGLLLIQDDGHNDMIRLAFGPDSLLRSLVLTARNHLLPSFSTPHPFPSPPRTVLNPCSRQIYLTFPADSTFTEEDVSIYFSTYGPVRDVRIPYQQKRMFGFVSFSYPETVKLILATGNPHLVCESRVLVKPYKEKGSVLDKYRKQQQQLLLLGSTMMDSSGQEALLLRRKVHEQELQQAIELQQRRFMGLQLLDFKNRSLSSSPLPNTTTTTAAASPATSNSWLTPISGAALSPSDKEESEGEMSTNVDAHLQRQGVELILPDSPFTSPTRPSLDSSSMPSIGDADAAAAAAAASAPISSTNISTNHLMASYSKSCFFKMPADYGDASTASAVTL